MMNYKRLIWIMLLMIFFTGCSGPVNDDATNVSEIIAKGSIEVAGNNHDIYYNKAISFKYDGENVVERLYDDGKTLHYYDDKDQLTRLEIFSHDRLIVTNYYTYDDSGREIRQESVIEQSKDKTYTTSTYDKNYKEINYYDHKGELSLVGEIELDDKDQMIKFTSKSKDGKFQSVSSYEYEGENLKFQQTTGDNGVIREFYYEYNEYGDKVSVSTLMFIGRKTLNVMYYENEYVDSKLLKQTEYTVQVELDESQVEEVRKRLQ